MKACVVFLALWIPLVAAGLIGQEAAEPDAAATHWHVVEKQVAGPGAEGSRPSTDLWFGDGKIRCTVSGFIFLMDEAKREFTVINTRQKTYVRTSMPLDMMAVSSEQLRLRFAAIRNTGTVEETGESTKILDRACRGYTVSLWMEYKNRKAGHRSGTVWATRDLPFDWKRLNKLLENLRVFYRRDAECRKELNKIQGFQMGFDLELPRGQGTISKRVVKIARETPPPGTYEVPEGYEKREKLEPRDLG